MQKLFISYRRDDTADVAGRLYDRLVLTYGKGQVFKDVDTVPLGVDFRDVLEDALAECVAMLVVIGRHWLTITEPGAGRRIDNPTDFVRLEVETALTRNIPVIPLLVQGAAVPAKDDLPPSLAPLSYRQGLELRPDPYFHQDVNLLLTRLSSLVVGTIAVPPEPANSSAARSYIPFARSSLFQSRPGEFENIEHLLFDDTSEQSPRRLAFVGVIGLGGVGKTQLAVEVAYRFQPRFPDGIFWMTATGAEPSAWQRQMADLAERASWIPPDDDPSHNDNEQRRARHMARYLAAHSRALLILDNVEDPNLITSVLPALAGQELACTVIYTSRVTRLPPGTNLHRVTPLPTDIALRLLLETTRPEVLKRVVSRVQGIEEHAAVSLCEIVGNLPLALIHLRGLLARDPNLSLRHLDQVVRERGILEITKGTNADAGPIFAAFLLSWEQVKDETAKSLFRLACYFPEALPIPLWLLGVALGLEEDWSVVGPLGAARFLLQVLSLFEVLTAGQVRLHPLVRAFGRAMLKRDKAETNRLMTEVDVHLSEEVKSPGRLQERMSTLGYWSCLWRLRSMAELSSRLGVSSEARIRQIEHWLNRESYLLDKRVVEVLPDLVYQQLVNRGLEEGHPFSECDDDKPRQWIRQLAPVKVEQGGVLRVFAAHSRGITSVAFSPNGRTVLTGSGDQLALVWSASTGQLLTTLEHSATVRAVSFSPRGTTVITGTEDGKALLWDIVGSHRPVVFTGHSSRVSSVAVSPDGTRALTGSYDGTARLWDATSGRQLVVFSGHRGPVKSVAFSPDSSTILTGSLDGTARLWDASQEHCRAVFEVPIALIGVNSVAFSPDASKIVTCSLDGARIWDIATGVQQVETGTYKSGFQAIAWSPEGNFILTGSDDGTARLWDATSGRKVAVFSGHRASVNSVTFSPDGSTILTGSSDGTARLWDVIRARPASDTDGEAEKVDCVALSSDGVRMFVGFDDRTISVWKLGNPDEQLLSFKSPDYEINCIACSPSGQQFVTGPLYGLPHLWDSSRGIRLQTFGSRYTSSNDAIFCPDEKHVVTADEKTTHIWDIMTGKKVLGINERHDVFSVAVSPDNSKVATGSWTGTVRIWDAHTGKRLVTLSGHKGWISSLAFSPDGKVLLTGSLDNSARLWDAAAGRCVRLLVGHSGAVRRCCFSPDGRLALSCDTAGRAMFWNATQPDMGELRGIYITGHEVKAVCWTAHDQLVLADNGGTRGHPYIYRLKLEGI